MKKAITYDVHSKDKVSGNYFGSIRGYDNDSIDTGDMEESRYTPLELFERKYTTKTRMNKIMCLRNNVRRTKTKVKNVIVSNYTG